MKLVPFESLGAVSYSPSIVTVAVSVAVCVIFCVWLPFAAVCCYTLFYLLSLMMPAAIVCQ